ncbi:MAG: hypothetical protein HYR76_08000 [Ignavibacteria bacterium]|nr:hypothetical protein [Ignavibacteria bacterium]MBI3766449.1 hypothetical protein [Ignavibacteriales bacterium]
MNTLSRILAFTGIMLIGAALFQSAIALPAFARKYNMSCSACHAGVPRLNEVGFKFRAAGFRMPDEIGKAETSSNIGDYIAARTQSRLDWKQTEAPNGAITANSKQLTFAEFSFYPITGGFAKNFASLVELTIAPEEFTEVENAYLRYDNGNENGFFSIRGGIFHPFEGYGASDRPLSNSRPLFQRNASNDNQSTYFTPWGFDEAGVEIGYDFGNTSLRGTLFNGNTTFEEEGKLIAAPAQSLSGNLSKQSGAPSFNSKDIQLLVVHRLTDDGGGISGYFYNGYIDLPTDPTNLSSAFFQNNFQRYALYASYPIEKALLLGGYQYGQDKKYNPTSTAADQSFNSQGFFGEADYNVSEPLWLGLRYDNFDPSTNKDENQLQAVTAFANYSFDNGLQFIGEYQYKDTKKSAVGSQKDNAVQMRMIFIY